MSSTTSDEATAQGSALCLELGWPALLTQRQTARVEHQPWEQIPGRAEAGGHQARAPPQWWGNFPPQ